MKSHWLFRVVPIVIGFVFVLLLCYYAAVGFVAYKAVKVAGEQDWSGGVKPVIERVWCGEPGCLGK